MYLFEEDMSESTLSVEVLKDYPNPVYIETGTGAGESVQVAIDADFTKIITIEANPEVYVKACLRFQENDNVLLVMGDSGKVLPGILANTHERTTFWLDAHWSTGEQDLGSGVNKCPILYDLRAIAGHEIKNHTILVDDIRYFRQGIPQWNNVRLGDIMEVVMNINPDYRMSFRDGHVKDDILVCEVK
jgi:hypothetical protein